MTNKKFNMWVVIIVITILTLIGGYFYLKAPTHNIAEDHVSSASEVDQWDLQSTYDMVIDAYDDPKLPVTCAISHIVDDWAFTDPSNMSVTCRATGIITAEMIAKLPKSEDVFSRSKGIGFKTIYIRRSVDVSRGLVLYVSYSSAAISGSFQNALSAVAVTHTAIAPVDSFGNDINKCAAFAAQGHKELADACMEHADIRERVRLVTKKFDTADS